MGKIPGTNILVDKFRVSNKEKYSYVFFLSHFHTDHYAELTNTWNLGIIYMTHETKQLCINKFPNLATWIVDLELSEPHLIFLDKERKESITVTLFDANHCPGSVMMLFEGKMGRILHTGDFRFTPRFFSYEKLFPKIMDNDEKYHWAIDIDHLIWDGTFSDQNYVFDSQDQAYTHIQSIVTKHRDYRVYLFAYQLGKEEIFLALAKHFKTKIVLTQERYKTIELIGLDLNYFTTDEEEGWIFVRHFMDRRKMDIEACNFMGPTIFIVLTGKSEFVGSKKNIFNSRYSSHSDSKELELFIKAIGPWKITFHSQPNTETSRLFRSYLQKTYCRGVPSTGIKQVDLHLKMIKAEEAKVSKKRKLRDFPSSQPFPKRKRFKKPKGAKLIRKQPWFELTDDEKEAEKAEDTETDSLGEALDAIAEE
jgi:DNA cross-link repair 1B protein